MLVADLLLDKPRIPAVLDQMGDIRPAEGMEVQAVIQAEGLAIGDKAGVEPLAPDPRSALRRPGRRVVAGAEQRADLGEPLIQDVGCPVPHGQHAAAPGRRALFALPNRTWQRPHSPNSAPCGLRPKSAASSIRVSLRR